MDPEAAIQLSATQYMDVPTDGCPRTEGIHTLSAFTIDLAGYLSRAVVSTRFSG